MTSYAQFYAIARTAHVERAIENQTQLYYIRRNYDFDEKLAESTTLVARTSTLRLGRQLANSGIKTLEINEPLMLPSWRYTVPALLLLGKRVRRSDLRIVTYAIENLSPVHRFGMVTRLPHSIASRIVRAVASWIYSRLDLIVFGTEGSQSLYTALIRERGHHPQTRLIPALPQAQSVEQDGKTENSFTFLGDLSERKGFDLLCEAWPQFSAKHPNASLTILGKGNLEPLARDITRDQSNVAFLHDPSRAQIREVLARSEHAILPSVTSPDWREQVGLPIIEAWSYGCRVLTSDATGIHEDLERAGHIVHKEPLSVESVTSMLESAIRDRPSTGEILSYLPVEDGRTKAWNAMREDDA